MDKKTKDFFENISKEGGSPVFSGKLPDKGGEFKLASWLRRFWIYLTSSRTKKNKVNKEDSKPVEEAPPEPKKEVPAKTTEELPKKPAEELTQTEDHKLIETLEKAHPEESKNMKVSTPETKEE